MFDNFFWPGRLHQVGAARSTILKDVSASSKCQKSGVLSTWWKAFVRQAIRQNGASLDEADSYIHVERPVGAC